MQGLSLDGALLPSLATARVPVATLSSPSDYGFGSHNVWDVPGELLNDAIGSLGGLVDATDPILAQASRTVKQADELRRQLGRFVGKDGQVHYQPEGEVSGDRLRRAGSRGSPRCSMPNFPIRTAALTGPGLVRHACRPAGAAAGRRQADGRGPRRVPARPRATRHRRARAHPRVERVRAPRRSRTTRTAPTTAPQASRS